MQRVLFFVVLLALSPALHVGAVPDGFAFSVLANDVPNARQMAEAANGVIYVGSRSLGNVYAVVPNTDMTDAEVIVVDAGLRMPSGVALHDGDLYVGAVNRILRYPNIAESYRSNPPPEVVVGDLPSDAHHGWKYLRFDADGFLYLNVGAPCNICLHPGTEYATIVRIDLASGERSIYAAGVRNSVGMTFHPTTGKLWFSDNGRDMLGDDVPPEEINVVEKPGTHFGYPFVHGDDILDPRFGKGKNPASFVQPVVNIQAHAAALGIAFYTGESFPAEYHNALFIAEHGSWNRTSKVGYRVSVVKETASGLEYEPFIDHWLKNERVSGRPNDVLVTKAGELLISDDHAGAIYRVAYVGE